MVSGGARSGQTREGLSELLQEVTVWDASGDVTSHWGHVNLRPPIHVASVPIPGAPAGLRGADTALHREPYFTRKV